MRGGIAKQRTSVLQRVTYLSDQEREKIMQGNRDAAEITTTVDLASV
jgi:hypothetical protein